ncbi:hypothetical protein EV356DRAFT_62306 [Viridothelium virens]|uniref:Uncharacterized protein n=1 Tax=Viridothelium virens TaxID=1048519 RepID=A0A6A6HGA6_VIRVR|nr:hypothetical protein EV356DRAFT_62306 [Viridothelium virens]
MYRRKNNIVGKQFRSESSHILTRRHPERAKVAVVWCMIAFHCVPCRTSSKQEHSCRMENVWEKASTMHGPIFLIQQRISDTVFESRSIGRLDQGMRSCASLEREEQEPRIFDNNSKSYLAAKSDRRKCSKLA